jgi:hypothetical protein
MGQQGNNPFDDAPRDTLALEDVTIAVLPFRRLTRKPQEVFSSLIPKK